MTGLGRRLKEHDPTIRLICMLPEVFPGIEGLKPLGPEDIVPAILDEMVIDERMPVTSEDAYTMCRRCPCSRQFVGGSDIVLRRSARVASLLIGEASPVAIPCAEALYFFRLYALDRPSPCHPTDSRRNS